MPNGTHLLRMLRNGFLLPKQSPSTPKWGANIIIATAFGRKSIPDRKLHRVAEIRARHTNDANAFLHLDLTEEFDAGPINADLAEETRKRWEAGNRRLPLYGQWEIMYAMYWNDPRWYESNRDRFHVIWPDVSARSRLSTWDLYRVIADSSDAPPYIVPILVAHPEHLPRCVATAIAIFRTIPSFSDPDPDEDAGGPFDPESTQWQIRGPKRFTAYETLARIHLLLKRSAQAIGKRIDRACF